MKNATIIIWILTGILVIYAWLRKDGSVKEGFLIGWKTFKRNIALLLLGFALVGFVDVLSPTKLIQDIIGPGTGLQGLVFAEVIGMLLPGGPYAVFPIIAILYNEGAGIAPAITIITSWSTQALISIPFEIPFMGWRFSAIRWGLGLVVPLLAGVAALLILN